MSSLCPGQMPSSTSISFANLRDGEESITCHGDTAEISDYSGVSAMLLCLFHKRLNFNFCYMVPFLSVIEKPQLVLS